MSDETKTTKRPRPPGPWITTPWQDEWDQQLRDEWQSVPGRAATSISDFARRFNVSTTTVRKRAIRLGLLQPYFAPSTACIAIEICEDKANALSRAMAEHDGEVTLEVSTHHKASLKVNR